MLTAIPVTILLLLFTGCEEQIENKPELNSIDVPEHLVIELDDEHVNEVETARIHTAKFLELDPQLVAEQVLAEDIHTTEVYAMGLQFQTAGEGIEEYLTVYDGGKAFGKYKDQVDGGFTYSKYVKEKLIPYSNVVSIDPGPPIFGSQINKHDLTSDFQTFVDLEFMAYEEVEQVILAWFEKIGITDIETEVIYALDAETMDMHYQRFLEVVGEASDFNWTKDEEAYLVHLRQVIDQIPLINYIWQQEVRQGNEVTETQLYVLYNQDGVYSADVRQLYHIIESSEEYELISSQEALQILIDHYQAQIITTETKVDQMTLYYVGVVDGDQYQLVPAWVFRIAEFKESVSDDGKSEPYYDYSFYVINAVNGNRISKSSETQ